MAAPTQDTALAPPLSTSRAWLVLAVFYVYLLLYGGTAHALLHPIPFALLRTLALAVLALGAVAMFRRSTHFESLGKAVDYGLIGIGAVAAITTGIAVEPIRSWENLGLGVTYVVLLYLTVNWVRRRASVYPLAVLIALGNVSVCIGAWLIPSFAPWLGGSDAIAGYLIYPLGHWNLTGSYLLLTSPILVGLALGPGGRVRWGWWVAFAFACLTIFQSGSRIAFLVAGAELVLAAIAFLVRGQRTIRRAAVVVLLVAVAIGFAFEESRIWQRLATLPDSGADAVAGRALSDESAAQRLDIWRGAWSKWHLIGNGLGSVPLQFGNQMVQSPRFPTLSVPHLHNSYLNLAYELGIPGLLAALLTVLFLFYASYQSLPQAGNDAPLILSAVWGLGGYLASLLVLYHPYVPAMTVTLVLVASLSLSRVVGTLIGQTRMFLSLNLTLAVAAVGIPFGASSYAFWTYYRSIRFWHNDRPAALEQLREAVHYDPLDLFPRLALGLALSHQPSRSDQEEGMQQLEWVNVRSQLAISRLVAGNLALQLHQPQRAMTILESGTRLRFYAGFYHYYLAQAYLGNARPEVATDTMATALTYAPVLLDAALWRSEPWLSRRDQVLLKAIRMAEVQMTNRTTSVELAYRLGRLYSAMGNQIEARAHLNNALQLARAGKNPQASGQWRHIQLAVGETWQREGDAQQAAATWAEIQKTAPLDPGAALALGRLAIAQGNPVQARPWLEMASATYRRLDPSLTPTRLAAPEPVTWNYGIARDEAWFEQAFRRPVPPYLGLDVTLQIAALPYADETKPWIYLPKVQATQLVIPERQDDIVVPTN